MNGKIHRIDATDQPAGEVSIEGRASIMSLMSEQYQCTWQKTMAVKIIVIMSYSASLFFSLFVWNVRIIVELTFLALLLANVYKALRTVLGSQKPMCKSKELLFLLGEHMILGFLAMCSI